MTRVIPATQTTIHVCMFCSYCVQCINIRKTIPLDVHEFLHEYRQMLFISSDLCLPGSYSETGLERCVTCLQGYYQNDYGQMSCIACSDGTTTTRRGAMQVSKCKSTQTTARPKFNSKLKLFKDNNMLELTIDI